MCVRDTQKLPSSLVFCGKDQTRKIPAAALPSTEKAMAASASPPRILDVDPVRRNDGNLVLKVVPATTEEIDELRAFFKAHGEVDVWKRPRAVGEEVHFRVSPDDYSRVTGALDEKNFVYEAITSDLQRIIDNQTAPSTRFGDKAAETYTQQALGRLASDSSDKPKYLVYLEGNVGIGKSTLLNNLKSEGYPVIPEPVTLWQNFKGINFLDLRFKDVHKWAFTFQTMALFTRWKTQLREDTATARIVIAERSVHSVVKMFGAAHLESHLLAPEQYVLLEDMADEFAKSTSRKQVFIYLRGNPTTAFDRIAKRARKEEETLSCAYLTTLHDKLDAWMATEENLQAVISAEGSPDSTLQQMLEQLNMLK